MGFKQRLVISVFVMEITQRHLGVVKLQPEKGLLWYSPSVGCNRRKGEKGVDRKIRQEETLCLEVSKRLKMLLHEIGMRL